ncbi:MAG: ABC transporter permease [Anaerolineales bacterium]|nr:ABC transporter permease [Anaerolineales bacterium]
MDTIGIQASMKEKRTRLPIIFAITRKDIYEAVTNKRVLTILITALLMAMFYRYLPNLHYDRAQPTVFLHDASESGLEEALDDGGQVSLRAVQDPTHIVPLIRESDAPELGLIASRDVDLALASGEIPVLEGYMVHWLSERQVENLLAHSERAASEALGTAVRIELQEPVSLSPETYGLGFLAATTFLFTLTFCGVALVPNLMIEERQRKTLNALLVSPAGAIDILLGKALAGLFYSMIFIVIIGTLFSPLIIRPLVTLLIVLVTAILFILLGLLLSQIIKHQAQFSIYGMAIFIPLLLPQFLGVMADLFPRWLQIAIKWCPGTVAARLILASFSPLERLGDYAGEIAYMLISVALLLALNVVLLRQADR